MTIRRLRNTLEILFHFSQEVLFYFWCHPLYPFPYEQLIFGDGINLYQDFFALDINGSIIFFYVISKYIPYIHF